MKPIPAPASRRLADTLRRSQDDFLAQSTATAEVAARLASAPRRSPHALRGEVLMGGLALAVAAAVLLWLRLGEATRPEARIEPLGWQVGDEASPRVVEPHEAAAALRFSDGSRFDVAPEGRVRVVAVTSGDVHLALDRGALEADVVSARARVWRIDAGALEVRVTGTHFTLGLAPGGALTVRTTEGRVEVRGPCLDGAVGVPAGESERFDCAPAPVEAATDEGPTAEAPTEPAPIAPVAPPPSSAPPRPRVSGAPSAAPATTSASPPAAEQLQAARAVEGQPVEQARRLEALRASHPDTPQAQLATFLLGRLALREGEAREAVARFDEYLAGRSTGTLAREARGLRLEALRQAGETERAAESAREYLRLYPEGPHARFAQELLSP